MAFKLDKNKPICPQIISYLSSMIASGEVKPNDKILSVRDVALKLGVNPNTVQKSYESLQAKGLIYSVRGVGWFACDNVSGALENTNQMALEKTNEYFSQMINLGFDDAAIKQFVKEYKYE